MDNELRAIELWNHHTRRQTFIYQLFDKKLYIEGFSDLMMAEH